MSRKESVKKEIDLSKLPKNKNGSIDKKNMCGHEIHFVYDNIAGKLEIIEYNKQTNKIKVKYNNLEDEMYYSNFVKCQLGKLLKLTTKEFKYKVGDRFQDDKRDITIIDMKYRQKEKIDKQGKKSLKNDKWYKYHCNVCGWTEGWIVESALEFGNGCPVCSGLVVVEGINDIPTVAPFMVKYFQGGYDEAKLYTKTGSGNPNNRYGYIIPKCPDCGRIKSKKIIISNIYKRHSIGCLCSDRISFGEKVMFSVLEDLKIDFKTQLTKSTFKWCQNYKYDFYFEYNSESYICEINGVQHYEQTNRKNTRTLKEEQENDRLKKELALDNGIKEENYIVIDCRKSELKWIKQNILDSNLDSILDMSIINWIHVEKFALSNRIKVACDYKRNNPKLTTGDIATIMKMSSSAIRNYLITGNKIGWCNYDIQEERIKSSINNGKANGKSVEIFKDGISLGVFPSATELERKSKELFNVKLYQHRISEVCLKKKEKYKGFIFVYI